MKKNAYAKINLGLKVLSKEENGYHKLDMIMEKISLCDTLEFFEDKDIRVVCENIDINQGENLVYKAILALKDEYPCQTKDKGIKIKLFKNIPLGAGLGGGSSDAACTILALNEIWGLNKNKEELKKVASKVGSDVPFFLEESIARVKGFGEEVVSFKKDAKFFYLIYYPGYKISTKEVYEYSTIYSNSDCIDKLEEAIKDKDFKNVLLNMKNDLMDAAFKVNDKEPKIEEMIKLFNDVINDLKVTSKAMMTGSGSCIFMVFDSNDSMLKVKKVLDKKGILTIIAASI